MAQRLLPAGARIFSSGPVWEKLVGVPGRDLSHFDFYRQVSEAIPDRSNAASVDLDALEAEVEQRLAGRGRTA